MNILPIAPNDLIAPAEVAALLYVDPKTVSRWAMSGKIHSIRTPGGHRRFLRSEILAMIAVSESGPRVPDPVTRQPAESPPEDRAWRIRSPGPSVSLRAWSPRR